MINGNDRTDRTDRTDGIDDIDGMHGGDGLIIACRWITVGLVVLTVLSGLWLVFLYRPTGYRASDMVRAIHNVASWLTLAAGLGWLVRSTMRRGRTILLAIPGLILTGLVLGTGVVLPYDHLALRAVTAGTDISGYLPLMGDDIVFVLVGGSELSTARMLTYLAVHLIVGTVLGFLILRLTRKR